MTCNSLVASLTPRDKIKAYTLLVRPKLHAEPDVFDRLNDACASQLADFALLIDGEEKRVSHSTEDLGRAAVGVQQAVKRT